MTRRGCDGCGRDLPVYRTAPDVEYPDGLGFCFLCVKEGERAEERSRFTDIRMVQSKADPSKYVRHTVGTYRRIKTPLFLEGVDGDEDANTITYWYTRIDPEMGQ